VIENLVDDYDVRSCNDLAISDLKAYMLSSYTVKWINLQLPSKKELIVKRLA
jgi:hypothetical protein